MATQVVMPKLSPTMEEGQIARWLKQEGDKVSMGEPLAEIDTDKATMEMQALSNGVLRKILIKEGESVPLGQMIAVIGEPDEDISALLKQAGAGAQAQAAQQADKAQKSEAAADNSLLVWPPPARKRRACRRGPSAGSVPEAGDTEADCLGPVRSPWAPGWVAAEAPTPRTRTVAPERRRSVRGLVRPAASGEAGPGPEPSSKRTQTRAVQRGSMTRWTSRSRSGLTRSKDAKRLSSLPMASTRPASRQATRAP